MAYSLLSAVYWVLSLLSNGALTLPCCLPVFFMLWHFGCSQGYVLFSNMANDDNLLPSIAIYWDEHIHDLAMTTAPVGTPEFFRQLDEYRYEKLNYLPRLVKFTAYKGKSVLEAVSYTHLTLPTSDL